MKKIKTFLTLICAIISLSACAQTTLFPTLKDQKDITYVYVSKALVKMAKTQSLGNINGINGRIDSIEIITSDENKNASRMVVETYKKFINENSGYETLMSVNDDGDSVNMTGLPIEGTDKYSRLILLTDDSDGDVTLIVINGEIDPSNMTI